MGKCGIFLQKSWIGMRVNKPDTTNHFLSINRSRISVLLARIVVDWGLSSVGSKILTFSLQTQVPAYLFIFLVESTALTLSL